MVLLHCRMHGTAVGADGHAEWRHLRAVLVEDAGQSVRPPGRGGDHLARFCETVLCRLRDLIANPAVAAPILFRRKWLATNAVVFTWATEWIVGDSERASVCRD